MALSMKQTRVQATRATQATRARKPVMVRASAATAGEVPSPEKRTTMNLLLAGGVGLPVLGLAGPVSRTATADPRPKLVFLLHSVAMLTPTRPFSSSLSLPPPNARST